MESSFSSSRYTWRDLWEGWGDGKGCWNIYRNYWKYRERKETTILDDEDLVDFSMDEDDGGHLDMQPLSIERAPGINSRKAKKQKVK